MSPLLHPRLRKSRDKPSIHIIMRLTIYFWQSVIEFAFSKQSVNGAAQSHLSSKYVYINVHHHLSCN